ncbi:MAG: response regulator transcription factor [Salinivirgaceae bacterium]|nr:response regulator transcription factor [Salinivirgaceae bacterium]
METQIIKIIIVDDNKTFLESLDFFLRKNSAYKIINRAYNGEQALKMEDIHKADIILMDIEMPNIDGIEATKRLLRENNKLKVIALTNYEEKAYLRDLIVSGFKGCVFKKNTFDQLENAIQKVLNGGMFFPENLIDG